MAYGGGAFSAQNKALPGAYINFISLAKAGSLLGDRGVVAIAMDLKWGETGTIQRITSEDFSKRSLELFGFAHTAPEMKWLREIFRNAKEVLVYRLNTSPGKATNTHATAKFGGTRGNALSVKIKNVISSKKEVSLLLDGKVVEKQVVSAASELADSRFVVWKKSGNLEETPGMTLTNGSDGTTNGGAHQAFLTALESYSFNALGLAVNDNETKEIYIAFIKRIREEIGIKAQLVLHNKAADYEGVVNVKNDLNLVYWALGALGGCPIEKSTMNKRYDGEYTFKTDYTHAELELAIKAGEYVLHRVGDEARVLSDINSLTTLTEDKGKDFSENQTIRVLDQIGNDIAKIFNEKYLGKIQNTDAGRTSFWSDLVSYNASLANIGAIEPVESEQIEVKLGDDRRSVAVINPVKPIHAMQRLYMTVIVG